jgi:glycosyltransferase involved in cell wall biosynthesis
VRILRVYHGGRDPAHRERERQLQKAGVDTTLVVPATWPGAGDQADLSDESFPILELPVKRPGDVNRHSYADGAAVRRLLAEMKPDVLDVHEEPASLASRQWLAAARRGLHVVMYTAQNVDKRYPPPFSSYERRAYRRVAALYPCSRQAASVAHGKGFDGLVEVIPLGFDPDVFRAGEQSLDDDELLLAFLGRLVPEKGVRDAVAVLARVNSVRPARLVVCGEGAEARPARQLAFCLGVGDRLEIEPWTRVDRLAEIYRRAHVVLAPSVPTTTWTEQFGRVIVEAQACGSVVVAYATGSIPEVAGGSATLAEPGNVHDMAEAVARLVQDPTEYARRRAEGLALSRTRTWARVAAKQADLYRRVASGAIRRSMLPRSPRKRRANARAEFGPTASTTSGERPFALPVLRRGGIGANAVASALDAAAEARCCVRTWLAFAARPPA